MPHCCPQKQQCVFTSRSGSTLVDRRTRVIGDRCGPNRAMMGRGSTGTSATLATLPLVEVLLPQRSLRQTEHCAAALGTDVLVVTAARQLVAKAEFLLDGGEITHHQLRGIRLPAAPACGLRLARARV